jgi:hypothetical protein
MATLVRSLRAPLVLLSLLSPAAFFACGSECPTPAAPTTVASTTSPTPPPTPTTASTPSASSSASSAPTTTSFPLSPAIDEKAVADATGVEKPEKSADGVVKVSFPRKDVEVTVDGNKLPPFLGLTAWIAFSPGKQGVSEAMMMGDLVLFEDEVNPIMSLLLDANVQVTALHNHFLYAQPNVMFMHVGGEGKIADLGGAVKRAMDEIATLRKKTPKPKTTSGAPKLPAKSTIDGAKLDAALSIKGASKDGMYKAVFGRKTNASCGCEVGKAMGVNTWAAFAGSEDVAVVDGDFAVTENELQPVLKSLRAGGIDVVAIHHHMSGETPKMLFLHYWGRGKPIDLAGVVKKTVDLTAWDKPTT